MSPGWGYECGACRRWPRGWRKERHDDARDSGGRGTGAVLAVKTPHLCVRRAARRTDQSDTAQKGMRPTCNPPPNGMGRRLGVRLAACRIAQHRRSAAPSPSDACLRGWRTVARPRDIVLLFLVSLKRRVPGYSLAIACATGHWPLEYLSLRGQFAISSKRENMNKSDMNKCHIHVPWPTEVEIFASTVLSCTRGLVQYMVLIRCAGLIVLLCFRCDMRRASTQVLEGDAGPIVKVTMVRLPPTLDQQRTV